MTNWFVSYAVYNEDNFVEHRGTLIKEFDSSLSPSDVLRKIDDELCAQHGFASDSLHFDAFNKV